MTTGVVTMEVHTSSFVCVASLHDVCHVSSKSYIRDAQDLIEELIGEEIEDETDASMSPSSHAVTHEGGGVKAITHEGGGVKPSHVRKRRETVTKRSVRAPSASLAVPLQLSCHILLRSPSKLSS